MFSVLSIEKGKSLSRGGRGIYVLYIELTITVKDSVLKVIPVACAMALLSLIWSLAQTVSPS